jgi:hypothetical protein
MKTYTICDIIRGAEHVVALVGNKSLQQSQDFGQLLKAWGSRVWTFPEVLLSRGDRSYALMGLLHIRPPVDRTDSGFQAFGRLVVLSIG